MRNSSTTFFAHELAALFFRRGPTERSAFRCPVKLFYFSARAGSEEEATRYRLLLDHLAVMGALVKDSEYLLALTDIGRGALRWWSAEGREDDRLRLPASPLLPTVADLLRKAPRTP